MLHDQELKHITLSSKLYRGEQNPAVTLYYITNCDLNEQNSQALLREL